MLSLVEFPVEALVLTAALAVISERFVTAFITPVFEHFKLKKFWLMYVAWAFASLLTVLAQINIFADIFPDPIVGRVITGVLAGGVSNIFHDWLKKLENKD